MISLEKHLVKSRPNFRMSSTKISEEQILLKSLPDIVWKHVFANLLFNFKTLDSCSKVSEYLDDIIKRNGHLSIISGNASRGFSCVPKSVGLYLFPKSILQKPQIMALNICVNRTFHPENDYLEWLIESQRDSLEILHVSCLALKSKPFGLVLAGMSKLRVLKIERTSNHIRGDGFTQTLTFPERPYLPALETLTLSAFGCDEWRGLLQRSRAHPHPEYSTCETVKHLCLLRADPTHLRWATREIGKKYVFPNLVSLEIPAMLLDHISKIFPDPGNLKRLTLTLPTRGFTKHLFDVCITGYGEQVCAAILANPDRDPQEIRAEIEDENAWHLDNFEYWERERIQLDNELRRVGRRFPNLTDFTGLEELCIKNRLWSWGLTVMSCKDLLSMASLKTLRFCEFYPVSIPGEMMAKLEERFTVITPNSDHEMDSSKINNPPVKQNLLEVMPENIWKQVLRHLSSSFQTLESCSEASDVFEDLIEKTGLLSINRDKIVPSNFENRISFHRGLTPIPRITTMNICVNSNFQPMSYYLNGLLESQRESLEILRISCLEKKSILLNVDLPEMKKLRDLKLVRNKRWQNVKVWKKSLRFREIACLPALESLTLSAFGYRESWKDFIDKAEGNGNSPNNPNCETVKHLRILPARPSHAQCLISNLAKNYLLPNLMSLEIPAVLLDKNIHNMFSAPETLKRLTLTLPTRNLHKHLFDVCITGYGEQVCATILANPDRDPQEIRAEIEEENERELDGERNDNDYHWEKLRVVKDNRLRRQGLRWPNINDFLGLEELQIKSDTGDYGPTVVSYPDLISMNSLKTLRFCGFYPKYIPEDMINDLKQRFTVSFD